MRRALGFGMLAAVLLLLPTAGALDLPLLSEKRAEPTPPTPEPKPEADPVPDPEPLLERAPAALAPPSSGAAAKASRLAPAVALGGIAALALLAALGLARFAGRPRRQRLKKRSFEAGRQAGWTAGVTSLNDAMTRLRGDVPAGSVKAARAEGSEVVVAIERRKREPCAFAQGYLTGLFESAYASDVLIRHDACAGKARGTACWYAISRSAGRAAGSSIPGSEAAPRRWPRAASARAAAGPRAPRSGSP